MNVEFIVSAFYLWSLPDLANTLLYTFFQYVSVYIKLYLTDYIFLRKEKMKSAKMSQFSE